VLSASPQIKKKFKSCNLKWRSTAHWQSYNRQWRYSTSCRECLSEKLFTGGFYQDNRKE